jgi:predicted TIM-barrel fold metal-dependent hydrolase
VVYPTAAGQMLGREFRDTKLLAACCRAYNDWAIDYCSKDPKRLRPSAILPMQDVEEAVKEANRAAKNGAVSFYIRPNPVAGRTLFSEAYLPLFAEIEKLGKPISTHESHLVRHLREIPQAAGGARRGRWRMGSLLAAADGAALEFQR